jgi:pimeloyl-ACP methyl ester carboxylesterase
MSTIFKLLLIAVFILGVSVYMAPGEKDSGELITLPYELSGKTTSSVMLVFLHGYPNTFRMWDKMIDLLKPNVLCLNVSYPNFAKNLNRKWGISFMEIIDLLKKTIELVDPNNDYKKVFVAHDWGSTISYMFDNKYPGTITDLLSLDVGTGIEKTITGYLYFLGYQSYLASNFLIGGAIGKLLTRLFISNKNVYGNTLEDEMRIDSSWNYLYFHFWKNLFTHLKILKNYRPSCPVAFVYGTQKFMMFHDNKFINMINENKNSEVHGVESDHWVMENYSKFLVDLIQRRINSYIA